MPSGARSPPRGRASLGTVSDAPPQPQAPLDPTAVLRWMRDNPDRLRALMADENADDAEPAGDAAVRAHLRLAAEALPHGADAHMAQALSGFAEGLPAWFDEDRDTFDRHIEMGDGAIALEEHLLFKSAPGADPTLHAALERKMRLGAWNRIFLRGLETRLGSAHDGLADAAIEWNAARGGELARLIITLDRAAQDAMTRRTGTKPARDEREQIGQVATVQGYVRQAIEGVAHALGHD